MMRLPNIMGGATNPVGRLATRQSQSQPAYGRQPGNSSQLHVPIPVVRSRRAAAPRLTRVAVAAPEAALGQDVRQQVSVLVTRMPGSPYNRIATVSATTPHFPVSLQASEEKIFAS